MHLVGGGAWLFEKSSRRDSCCARFSRGTGPETPGESPAGPGPKLPANLPRTLARNSREGLPRARAQDSRGDLPHPGLGFKVWAPNNDPPTPINTETQTIWRMRMTTPSHLQG